MNNRSGGEPRLYPELNEAFDEMAVKLELTLNLRQGCRDIAALAEFEHLADKVSGNVDLRKGLASILRSAAIDREEAQLAVSGAASFSPRLGSNWNFLDYLTNLDGPARLLVRSQTTYDCLAFALHGAKDLASVASVFANYDSRQFQQVVKAVAEARERLRQIANLESTLKASKSTIAVAEATRLDSDLAYIDGRARTIEIVDDSSRRGDMEVDIRAFGQRALVRVFRIVNLLASSLIESVNTPKKTASDLVVDVDRVSVLELDEFLHRLEEVGIYFAGCDLSGADLADLRLDGVQWTATTIWPEEWVARIKEASREISPGIFEIAYSNGPSATAQILEPA